MKALAGYLVIVGILGDLLQQIPPPPPSLPLVLQVAYYAKYLGAALAGGGLLHFQASPTQKN